jgi:Mg/Co/Ni transporter MgtE
MNIIFQRLLPINWGLVILRINHKYKVEVVIMKAVWIAFICGFLLGGMIGISLMCLFSINKSDKPSDLN